MRYTFAKLLSQTFCYCGDKSSNINTSSFKKDKALFRLPSWLHFKNRSSYMTSTKNSFELFPIAIRKLCRLALKLAGKVSKRPNSRGC